MTNKKTFIDKKIKKNPDICVSYYLNDIDWLVPFFDRCIVYDKSWKGAPTNNHSSILYYKIPLSERYNNLNIKKSSINGYNIYDYLQYIIDYYYELPDIVYFIKGNVFPRHCSQNYVNVGLNNCSPIKFHDNSFVQNSINPVVAGNTFIEANTSWYTDISIHKSLYFSNYSDFFSYCFPEEKIPTYLKFTPGACFSVSSKDILKYPIDFYKNLKIFVSHDRLPSEALYLERTLETIFENNYKYSFKLNNTLNQTDLKKLIYFADKQKNKLFRILKRIFWKLFLKLSWAVYYKSVKNLKR